MCRHYLKILMLVTTASCTDNTHALPLILTPYIKSGKIAEAHNLAEVHLPELDSITSYSGFFTVDERYDSNLFFWFFRHQNYKNVPLLLWLQGGPGASSLYGLVTENGPFTFAEDGSFVLRESSWTKTHSVVYIDNPVGSGFSFTGKSGFVKNESVIGEHLFEGLIQFFGLFPEMQGLDFYVTGESYAGKYMVALGKVLHEKQQVVPVRINLKGFVAGNALFDPINQSEYAEYLHYVGLLDFNGMQEFKILENKARTLMQQEKWLEAFKVQDEFLYGSHGKPTLFNNLTGFLTYFDLNDDGRHPKETKQTPSKFFNKPSIRESLHTGNATFFVQNPLVIQHLLEDMCQSVAPALSQLLNNYRFLFYSGQFDIIVPHFQTEKMLRNLNFSGVEAYKSAPRKLWFVGDALAGYYKEVGNLTEVLVRNSGHMVPSSQPLWALEMVTRFTHKRGFD